MLTTTRRSIFAGLALAATPAAAAMADICPHQEVDPVFTAIDRSMERCPSGQLAGQQNAGQKN